MGAVKGVGKGAVETIVENRKDYKYNDASKKLKSLDLKKINRAIKYTHKIEKNINEFGYEIENSKRYIVSIKKLLEF